MKGKINYYGKDQISYVLLNSGGHDEDSVASADERIATYGMQGIPRVRIESAQLDRDIPAMFGHFGYGSIVIDADGKLRGANLNGDQVAALLAQLDPEPKTPFAATTKLINRARSGFNLSKALPRPITATVRITLQLPAGYQTQASAPPVLQVAYADHIKVGAPLIQTAEPPSADSPQPTVPTHIDLPIEIPKGTPIGQYFLHGTITFTPSGPEGPLPPTELRWHTKIPAL